MSLLLNALSILYLIGCRHSMNAQFNAEYDEFGPTLRRTEQLRKPEITGCDPYLDRQTIFTPSAAVGASFSLDGKDISFLNTFNQACPQ